MNCRRVIDPIVERDVVNQSLTGCGEGLLVSLCMERIDRRTRLGSKWTGLDFRLDVCWDLGENRWRGKGTNS